MIDHMTMHQTNLYSSYLNMPSLRKAARQQNSGYFDASVKSTTGVSLNDMLMVGPTIQQDLISIVLRFRMHTYAMTADISKMYQKIRVHPEVYNLQRILWRRSSDKPVIASDCRKWYSTCIIPIYKMCKST